ncbi:MAG: DUF4249 domain-containing protein [Bacteroidales bacterium]|nr:DUF4249 domain-containing protein [Bacteroidales bacterium]
MRYLILFITGLSLLLVTSCIIQFIPEIEEDKALLVVEGLITDQYRTNTIKVSTSLPLGKILVPKPVKGCKVSITDKHGMKYDLKESSPGTYITDSTKFHGQVNDIYTLTIQTNNRTFVSNPMEMKPVPLIDSVYYEKTIIDESNEFGIPLEGCQIYIDSHDPLKECLYFRWNFTETWEFHLPFSVPNRVCWKTNNSDKIFIKNTSLYNQARVTKFPIKFISNETDRLKVKYSILVTQYSLNKDEYTYWEKVKNVSENVGGLYDVTPMSIPSNIHCFEDPDEPVLGYFSVSALTQNRIFIQDKFLGSPNFYSQCVPGDTVFGLKPIPGLNVSVWIIEDHTFAPPIYRITTPYRRCADCTAEGFIRKPPFWID